MNENGYQRIKDEDIKGLIRQGESEEIAKKIVEKLSLNKTDGQETDRQPVKELSQDETDKPKEEKSKRHWFRKRRRSKE